MPSSLTRSNFSPRPDRCLGPIWKMAMYASEFLRVDEHSKLSILFRFRHLFLGFNHVQMDGARSCKCNHTQRLMVAVKL